jgi:TRAP-type C4-dicarboxylate transport system permease small subunit
VEGFFRFNRQVMLYGKILVGAIMTGATFLLFINVVLRYVFDSGIIWAEEMTRYTMLLGVFVGAGVVTREDA